MSAMKCASCRYYQSSNLDRKGWCRNPLLFSDDQDHLVGENDLDCNRGMGSYWEAQSGDDRATKLRHGETRGRFAPPLPRTIAPAPHPVSDAAPRRANQPPQIVPRATTAPVERVARAAMPDPAGFRESYDVPREPYSWGTHLRRSYPVIGVFLLLGAFWVWSNRQLSDSVVATPTVPIVIPAASNAPVAVITPTAPLSAMPAASAASAASTLPAPPPGVIAPGARMVVTTSGAGANIREEPTTTGKIVTSQDDGVALTITGPSRDADGYIWWPVQGDGFSGWVAGALIALAP